MKTVFKLLLMAVAYLAIFILGAASGAIHPACYAYIGALLPLLSAFVYLTTATTIRSFGAATFLPNSFATAADRLQFAIHLITKDGTIKRNG